MSTKETNKPGFKCYVVMKNDDKSQRVYFAISDGADVFIHDSCNLYKLDTLNVEVFMETYTIADESYDSTGKFSKLLLDLVDKVVTPPVLDDGDATEPVCEVKDSIDDEYMKNIINSRYTAFIEKLKKTEIGKHIRVEYADSKVYMEVVNISVWRQKSGMPILRYNGRSIQASEMNSKYGKYYNIMKGNAESFVDIMPIDMAMFLKKNVSKDEVWHPYIHMSPVDAVTMLTKELSEESKQFIDECKDYAEKL